MPSQSKTHSLLLKSKPNYAALRPASMLKLLLLALPPIITALIFLPPLLSFLTSIENGMQRIDALYPYPQSREPLYKNPILIYIHMYSNTCALAILFPLMYFCHPPNMDKTLHKRLVYAYTLLISTGTVAGAFYASKQPYGTDSGKSGFFAFFIMAFVTFYTLFTTVYYSAVRPNTVLHREWAIRHGAVVFGNSVVFRLLANTFLVGMQAGQADFYAAWCQMVYLSWLGPWFVAEWGLAWERST